VGHSAASGRLRVSDRHNAHTPGASRIWKVAVKRNVCSRFTARLALDPESRHPDAIGLSVVRLLAVNGSTLEIAGIDLLDQTPVLDIKPCVPEFDAIAAERTGWLQHVAGGCTR